MISRLRRPAGALLATAVAGSIFGIIPAAHAADGTISGNVTDEGVTGLEDVTVFTLEWDAEDEVWDDTGYETSTDSVGAYSLSMPAGRYAVGFRDYQGAYVTEYYDDAFDVADATTVTVTDDEATVLEDAELALAGHVTGRISGPVNVPLDNAYASAYALEADNDGDLDWRWVSGDETGVDGLYDIGSLPTGTYRIGFQPYEDNLAGEFYEDQASVWGAVDIPVEANETIGDIDAQLDEESQISGTVTDETNAPVAEADVLLSVQGGDEWDFIDYATTDAQGHYTLPDLSAGTYRVEFDATVGGEYAFEVFNNKGEFEDGDDIVVESDDLVDSIDAQLVPGEHDPVVVPVTPFTMTSAPTVSGTTQVGSTLTATGGSWVPTPASTEFYWFSGEEYTGVSGPTYLLTAADLGKTFSVLVQVWGPEDQYDFANTGNIGPITAVPVAAPPVVTPAPVPVPAPAPVISFSKKIDVVGALTVGSTLKLKNFKALVSRAVVSYKIQWYAGSKKIKKATKSKLKVTKAMKGKKLSVKVSATSGTTTKTVKVKVGKIR